MAGDCALLKYGKGEGPTKGWESVTLSEGLKMTFLECYTFWMAFKKESNTIKMVCVQC